VSRAPRVQRIAEWLIRAACRRLPADVRAERCREWVAEVPAILDDQSIRPSFLRALRALSFCVGISMTARRLSRSANRPPDVAVRAVLGFIIYLVIVAGFIALVRTHPHPSRWLLVLGLALAVGFDAFCLIDIARATQVRYLSKLAWVIICLIQTPLGGTIYLSIGHIGRSRPVPPGDAKP
jgi:hypothetical protein